MSILTGRRRQGGSGETRIWRRWEGCGGRGEEGKRLTSRLSNHCRRSRTPQSRSDFSLPTTATKKIAVYLHAREQPAFTSFRHALGGQVLDTPVARRLCPGFWERRGPPGTMGRHRTPARRHTKTRQVRSLSVWTSALRERRGYRGKVCPVEGLEMGKGRVMTQLH